MFSLILFLVGLTAGAKVGVVIGILVIAILLVLIACLKLKFFPREQRLKLKPVRFSFALF